MVKTNDSRIRFIDIRVINLSYFKVLQNGKVIYKIKGHKDEAFPIKASLSEDLAYVVCGSECGGVFLWS